MQKTQFISTPLVRRCQLSILSLITLLMPLLVFSQQHTSDSSRTIIRSFFEQQAGVSYIEQVMISPDGSEVVYSAYIPGEGQQIFIQSITDTSKRERVTAANGVVADLDEGAATWSPDGRYIAFLSNVRSKGQLQVYLYDVALHKLSEEKPVSAFDGYISHLGWSPDGRHLSLLYVEKASREPSPMAAENRQVGLIDSTFNRDVQRLVTIETHTGKMEWVSPENLYVFEYDWSPDAKLFVYTAARPPGDDNWYIASIYQQSISRMDTSVLYKPLRQVALPRYSRDGRYVGFIEGLMSDQGGTGGDIFMIETSGKQRPINLTPKRKSTPSWFTWNKDGNILFSEFTGGSVAVNELSTRTKLARRIWGDDVSLRAGSEQMSLSIAEQNTVVRVASIRSSWSQLPEIYAGGLDNAKPITSYNKSKTHAVRKAENITWKSDQYSVQGWLLYPDNYDPSKTYPMLVCVHGGPAWISTPTWYAPDFNTTVYTKFGYFIFFPNPRGSHGQGEAFTLANRGDWGFGDLRDIIRGVDAVAAKFPVNKNRVGMLGWSYGGSMAMISVTQTNRFRAAVAGAGAADWESYYGQNAIDKWMWSYFGTSPYYNPQAYTKSSAMTYIRNAKTPTLILVGERDGEAPPAQSLQFWHALKELHVPTQLMIYADEGHSFSSQENRVDLSVRTLEWFQKYMPQ